MPDYTITVKDYLYRRFPIVEEPRYASFWKFENGKKVPSSAAFKTKRMKMVFLLILQLYQHHSKPRATPKISE